MHKSKQFKWGENEKSFFSPSNAVNSPDDEYGEMRLFPDELKGSVASASECTGLIQVAPDTKALNKVYDDLYSYRKVEE